MKQLATSCGLAQLLIYIFRIDSPIFSRQYLLEKKLHIITPN